MLIDMITPIAGLKNEKHVPIPALKIKVVIAFPIILPLTRKTD
jgi:hypothetical protein